MSESTSVIDLTVSQNTSRKRKREEIEDIRENQKVTPKREWEGIVGIDGRLRLVQRGTSVSRKGRLAKWFDREKLISIAWKTGVTNPDGFDQSDCHYFGVTPRTAYEYYVDGWKGYRKNRIIQFISTKLILDNKVEYM